MEASVISANDPLIDPLTVTVPNGVGDERAGIPFRSKKEIQVELCKMDNEDIKCGLGSCKPNIIQGLARKELYLVLYCLVGIVMGMFFTYSVSVISTIEKRFNISSKQTGIMLSGNDVSQVLLSMLITYYGNYGNRPRWMGFGVICAAISCFIAAAPHWIYGSGTDAMAASATMNSLANNGANSTLALAVSDVCPNSNVEACDVERNNDSGQSYQGPVIILFISQFFVGVSISTYYCIGIIYLDDNISKKDTPLYYGISMIVRVLGPVMGFFLGSQCLSIWIDPTQNPDISQRDPRWVGAWWLGFLILGFLLVFVGFLLLFFPRQLPSSLAAQVVRLEKAYLQKSPKNQQTMEQYIQMTHEKKKHTKPSMKKLPVALRRLVTNKIWLGNSFNTILVLLAYSGYWSFKPKYLETQFHKSASVANFFTGIASLVASVLGILLGGIVMRWKQPRARLVTGYNVFITFLSGAVMFSLMFVGCPKVEIQGYNDVCSVDCQCSDKFLPVCADTGETYYSACLAGCTSAIKKAGDVVFSNCSCIHATNSSSYDVTPQFSLPVPSSLNVGETYSTATQGYCAMPCDSFVVYIVLNIISKMVSASGRVGGTLVFLRSVAEEDKALALGTLTVFISLFAFIPGPIIMGAIVDSSCLIWNTECNQRGNCWVYDSDRFRIGMHLFTAGLIFVSILGDVVVFMNSKHLKLYDEPDDDIEINENDNKPVEMKQPASR